MNSSANNSILSFYPFSSGSSLGSEDACFFPSHWFAIEYTVLLTNIVMGYPANIMVIWLVARKEIDSSTSNVCFINQAIVDASYSLTIPLMYLSRFFFPLKFSSYFVSMMLGIKETSPLFLTCICLDRYMAVVHPIVFTRIKDIKIRVAISMLVWLCMIAYCFMRELMKTVADMFFSGMILTISIFMVFCNISIMRSLRKSVLSKEKISPMKKKAQRTVQITLAIIVFHYLPSAVTSPLYYLTESSIICVMDYFSYIIMDLSCSTEPLLCISKVTQLLCLNNLPFICCRSSSPEPHNVRT